MINSSLHGVVSARNEETQAEPNYTQVPNALMDRWIPELSGAELKVLLYHFRRTYGFHRYRVEAGLRRIFYGRAVKCLEARGLLRNERRSGGRTIYHVRLITDGGSQKRGQNGAEVAPLRSAPLTHY